MPVMPPTRLPMDPWDAAPVWRWYTTRIVKGGPEIACELLIADGDRDADTGDLLSDQRLIAVIDGAESDASQDWPRGWPWRAVVEERCAYLAALSVWAKTNDPNHPLAMPHLPMQRDAAALF